MGAGGYRADIDGLRAVAVLPVLFFHAGIAPFTGGYAGVDVFFVISGFLITGLIQREQAQGRISFCAFYDRRIRRILPALAAMLAVATAVAVLLLMPDELADFGKSLGGSALFVANLVFWYGNKGYFGALPAENPLLHVWSLAVEEQFYLLWPLFLVWLPRRRVPLLPVLAIMGALSFGLALWLLPDHPKASFFLLPTRAWELLLGAMLAVAPLPRPAPHVAGLLSLGGLGLVFAAMVQPETSFPGWAVGCAVAGAFLTLAGGETGNPVSRLLGSIVPRFVGRISYSLYLWHWPLLVFARLYLTRPLTTAEAAIALLAAGVLALLSWRFVEMPLRRVRPHGAVTILSAAIVSLVLAAIGFVLWYGKGWPQRMPLPVREVASESGWDKPYRCLNSVSILGSECRLAGTEKEPSMLVWGDSFADALAPGLVAMAREHDLALWEIARPACPALPDRLLPNQSHLLDNTCQSRNDAARRLLSRRKFALVVIHSRWDGYIQADPATDLPRLEAEMDRLVEEIGRRGSPVLVVGTVPGVSEHAAHCRGRNLLLGRSAEACTDAVPTAEQRMVDAMIARMVRRHPGARAFFPAALLCQDGRCPMLVDGHLLLRDTRHLTTRGAMAVGGAIQARFQGRPLR